MLRTSEPGVRLWGRHPVADTCVCCEWKVQTSLHHQLQRVQSQDQARDTESVAMPHSNSVAAAVDFYAAEAAGNADAEQITYGTIPDDLLRYCKGIETALSEHVQRSSAETDATAVAESAEQLELMVVNVFEQLDQHELVAATDGDCSRIVEKLLRHAPDSLVICFADRLAGSYPDLFRHQFASHVCQTILRLGAAIVHKELNSIPLSTCSAEAANMPKDLPSMQTIISEMCEQIAGQWLYCAKNQYASHVLRTLIHVLAGVPSLDESSESRSKKSRVYNYNHRNMAGHIAKNSANILRGADDKPLTHYDTPDSFREVFNSILTFFTDECDRRALHALAVNATASPVLQLVIKFKPQDDLIRILLELDPTESIGRGVIVSAMITDKVGSHLTEKLIDAASDEVIAEFYETHVKSVLMDLVNSPTANFVIQHLIGRFTDKETLGDVVRQIGPHFEDLIKFNRAGVVCKVVEQCAKSDIKVDEVVESLANALGAPPKSGDFVYCMLHLTPKSKLNTVSGARFKVQGSLILQALCKSSSQVAVNTVLDGIMSLQTDDILRFCRDAVASRFVECVLTSEKIPTGAKRKFSRRLIRSYGKLAADKYGSHIVDKCWANADNELREKIAEDLEKSYSFLVTSMYGKFIIRNFNIETFKRSRKEWNEKLNSRERKRKMFEDILQ